ncbi:MAG: PAS domain S-box protein, partial [Gammaproteobacteria bacterium]|nr:PAS domain S-box protein [Gammaproteobacteria bacterium]
MQETLLQLDLLMKDSTLFDAINTGLIVLNQKGEVVIWNKWMSQYSFIEVDKALNQPVSILFPDMSKRLQKALSDALSLRLSSIISAKLCSSGLPLYKNLESSQLDKRVLQSMTVTPVQMQQQNWCLLQVKDATERENYQASLNRTALEIETMVSKSREQEFQLQTILNNTLDSIVILNRLGRISGFYRSAQKMFGFSEYEILGKPLSVLFPAPFNRRFELLISEANLDEPFSFFDQTRSLKANGEIFDSDIAINSIFEGKDMQFIITIKDVTERQRAQDALYQEKEQAQVTLSSIADGVITTDIIGQINFVNPAALKLTGYELDDLIAKKLDHVISIQTERTLFPVFECIKSGQQVESAAGDVLIAKNGQELIINQVASPIHNQVGGIIGAVMIFRDVSKSHRLASRLTWQASHDELTQLYNRREFENQLETFIDTARNEVSQHCLCYLDMDKFKVVNDTCG